MIKMPNDQHEFDKPIPGEEQRERDLLNQKVVRSRQMHALIY